jgi:hypothetical protein
LASSGEKTHRPSLEVDVPCLDGEDLLEPAARLPADDQQVAELLVLDVA